MDESGVGLFLVSSVAPLFMGRPEKHDFFWTFCQRIGATCHDLLAGNHVDLPDQGTCHVSLIHLFVSFQMLGPIAYK